MFIRTAEKSEGCDFVITDGTNILKKLNGSSINFTKELETFQKEYENQQLQQRLFEAQTDLLFAQQENQDLGKQLFDLQTLLIQKGVI